MSKYTTQIRFICETAAGLSESAGYKSVNDILTKSAPKIFDFDYPIFDEDYRLALEIKILKHYYTREIGAETVGLWKLWLDQRMNEIMPYYNEKYEIKKKALEQFKNQNLFDNVNLKTTRTENTEGTNDRTGKVVGNTSTGEKTESNGRVTNEGSENERRNDRTNYSGVNKDAYSDTPQSSLSGVDELRYLTNYRRINDSNDTTTTANTDTTTTNNQTNNNTTTGTTTTNSTTDSTDKENSTTTRDYIESVIGKNGGKDYMSIYKSVYEGIVNIDMEIIESLSDLFFSLW